MSLDIIELEKRLRESSAMIDVEELSAVIRFTCCPITAGRFDIHLEEVAVLNSDLVELPVEVHSVQNAGYGQPKHSTMLDTTRKICGTSIGSCTFYR